MSWTIERLAEALGLAPPAGGGGATICGVATLERAGPEDLAFVTRERFVDALVQTRAGCVIVRPDLSERVPSVALVTDHPHLDFARAANLLHPDPPTSGLRAATAAIATSARVADDVDVCAGAVIGADAVVGEGTRVGEGVVIGPQAEIGPGCVFEANVVIAGGSRVGARARMQPGAVIGGEGFGYLWDGRQWIRIPQVGRVVLGDDVQVGASTTIDRGALDDTVIGNGVLLDNLIQVAHNVRIGDHTAIAGCAGVAGSAVIGRRCTIGGGAGIVGHIEIADDVHIAAMSLVSHSITEAGTYASGTPMDKHAAWRRNAARFRQLDQLARRIQQLERSPGRKNPGGT